MGPVRMHIKSMSDIELMTHYTYLKGLHTGSQDKTFFVEEVNNRGLPAHNGPEGPMRVKIKDSRLNQVLWELYIEAFNELCTRFPRQISDYKSKGVNAGNWSPGTP